MDRTPPDRAYLDAFLQGARFALFAVEGRLSGKRRLSPDEVEEIFREFHALFRDAYASLAQRQALVTLTRDSLGKN